MFRLRCLQVSEASRERSALECSDVFVPDTLAESIGDSTAAGSCESDPDSPRFSAPAGPVVGDSWPEVASFEDGTGQTVVGMQLRQLVLALDILDPSEVTVYQEELVEYLDRQITIFERLVSQGGPQEPADQILWGLAQLRLLAEDLAGVSVNEALWRIDDAELALGAGRKLLPPV